MKHNVGRGVTLNAQWYVSSVSIGERQVVFFQMYSFCAHHSHIAVEFRGASKTVCFSLLRGGADGRLPRHPLQQSAHEPPRRVRKRLLEHIINHSLEELGP